jgi:hypothetical protein
MSPRKAQKIFIGISGHENQAQSEKKKIVNRKPK